MANEAILRLKYEDPIDFIVADGTAISKGTLLKLTDPRTAAATAADEDVFAGIAARDKVASDGRTRLAVYRRGIFALMATAAAITAGDAVAIGGANTIKKADASCVGSKVIGIALESTTGSEAIEVELNIGAGTNAFA
jgi:hypothetical protein